jgi:glycosyltransferase involved in cell wall biosynthesis
MKKTAGASIAYLASELGTLSGTFVYREIRALRRLGATVVCFGTRRPQERVRSEEANSVVAETTYLYDSVGRIAVDALAFGLRNPRRLMTTLQAAWGDCLQGQLPDGKERLKLVWHAVVGLSLARRMLRHNVGHVHAHFAHVPTSIAMYAGIAGGMPFSFTGHANDLFERPTLLPEKLGRCAFSSCISDYNRDHLRAVHALARLPIVRCGIDLDEFAFSPHSFAQVPHRILFVGRLVEKKGPSLLLEALAKLRNGGTTLVADIVGTGPLLESLTRRSRELGLATTVQLHGAQPQEKVRELLYRATVFVLPCVVSSTGDQDGIPVALMEAMAAGVPVLSTRVSGIPELIETGVSGLLVDPGDSSELASALASLLSQPELRRTLAHGARRRIEEEFSLVMNARRLLTEIQSTRVEASGPSP